MRPPDGGGAAPPRPPGRLRAGTSAAELVVVLALGGLVVSALMGAVAATRRVATGLVAASVRSDALRTVRGVASGELRNALPGRDHRVMDRETLALRAFRGTALPCRPASAGSGALRVRYAGHRLPNAAKDSVLVLEAPGRWTVADLSGRRASGDRRGCPKGPGTVEAWTLDPAPAEPRLLRLYEFGEYHIALGAFRYRRDGGGRQPLTPVVLDGAGSAWEAGAGGSVRVRLTLLPVLPGNPGRKARWTLWSADPPPGGRP